MLAFSGLRNELLNMKFCKMAVIIAVHFSGSVRCWVDFSKEKRSEFWHQNKQSCGRCISSYVLRWSLHREIGRLTQGGVLGVVLLDYVVTPGPYPVLIAVFRAVVMTGGKVWWCWYRIFGTGRRNLFLRKMFKQWKENQRKKKTLRR